MKKKRTRALSSRLMNKQIANSKRSQFKIQQMSFMLLAVILFFILAALFWLTIQYRSLHKQAGSLEENKASLIAGFLSQSQEFSCVNENYCIDADKVMMLKNRSIYSEFWPVSYIKIRKVYPRNDKLCNFDSYPDCGIFDVYENKMVESSSSISSFVALCRQERVNDYPARICELGKLIIGYEVR